MFAVAYSLEYATLFGALGLFAMKLYEVATNIEKMITSEALESAVTREKKRNCVVSRWILFVFVSVPILAIDVYVVSF